MWALVWGLDLLLECITSVLAVLVYCIRCTVLALFCFPVAYSVSQRCFMCALGSWELHSAKCCKCSEMWRRVTWRVTQHYIVASQETLILNNTTVRTALQSTGSGCGSVAGCFECGIEPLRFMKVGEYFDRLNDWSRVLLPAVKISISA